MPRDESSAEKGWRKGGTVEWGGQWGRSADKQEGEQGRLVAEEGEREGRFAEEGEKERMSVAEEGEREGRSAEEGVRERRPAAEEGEREGKPAVQESERGTVGQGRGQGRAGPEEDHGGRKRRDVGH